MLKDTKLTIKRWNGYQWEKLHFETDTSVIYHKDKLLEDIIEELINKIKKLENKGG